MTRFRKKRNDSIVLGKERAQALKIASDFTALTIEETVKNAQDPRFGVAFEAALPALGRMLE